MPKEAANRRVFVIDDDDAVRDSTTFLLQSEGYEVEAFSSGSAFLESVSPSYKGCVITDVRMPGINGVELIAQMRKKSIPLPVIVVTAYADVPLAVQAMKLGASDLLTKPFDIDALLAALEAALNQNNSEEALQSRDRLATLTLRENAVLCCLLAGMSNKEIAQELGISVRTAEVHRANIMAKTQARSLAGLIKLAVAADLAQLHRLPGTAAGKPHPPCQGRMSRRSA